MPDGVLMYPYFSITAMLDLFGKHKHDGRVILPLLKTISLLMNRLCIDRLVEDISFAEKLLGHLREEESSCEDVHRLAAIIDVALGLVGAKNDCQKVSTTPECRDENPKS